jgi:hypothetical protein
MIVLDKPRQLKYDWPAVRALAKHGINIFERQQEEDAQRPLDPERFGLYLWAGLLWEDKTLTVDYVHEKMITFERLEEIDAKVGEAMAEAIKGDGVDPTQAAGKPQTFTGPKPPPD